MALKMNTEIPYDVDVSNKDELHDYLVILKQYVEEIVNKAKSVQMEVYPANPINDDVEEGEDVRTTTREYTKVNGILKYKALT